ncbi:MAG: hypothetical protein ACRECV_01435 [Xanthobacteraceae bacterium]
MVKLLYLRIAGAVAFVTVAFLLISFEPFLRAAPLDPGASAQTSSVTVNRFRKGDLLPRHPPRTVWRDFRRSDGLQSERKVPFGCDPAFSPVSSPALGTVFGRCMA